MSFTVHHRRAGFTLKELLLVVVIIILLVGLLTPVVVQVRRRSYESSCISNLRQLITAFTLYREDFRNVSPKYPSYLLTYVGNRQVYICPADTSEGLHSIQSNPVGTPSSELVRSSYLYFGMFFLTFFGIDYYDLLVEKDSNHGVFACALHGQKVYSQATSFDDYKGKVLRARLDGSIQHSRVEHVCYRYRDGVIGMRPIWSYFTDVRPIPPEVLKVEFDIRGTEPAIVECPDEYR